MSQPVYTFDDVEKAVGPSAFWEGQEYFEDGRVLKLDLSENQKTILASVKGQFRKPHTVQVDFEATAGGGVKFTGHCSCPVGTNCKHVAAALIEGIGAWEDLSDEDEPEGEELSLNLGLWLQDLDRAIAPAATDSFSEEERQRLIYCLQPPEGEDLSAGLSLASVRVKSDGSYGSTATPFDIDDIVTARPAPFLRPVDIEILRDLYFLVEREIDRLSLPVTTETGVLLQRILDTGRVRFLDTHGPALASGNRRKGQARWQHSELGRQRLEISAQNAIAVLPCSPPFYVDTEAGACGPIDLSLPPRVAGVLMQAPEVSAQDARQLGEQLLEKLGAGKEVPVPMAPQDTESRMEKPTPRLKLFSRVMELDLPYFFQTRRRDWRPVGGEFKVPLINLDFEYGTEHVDYHDQTPAIETLDGDTLVRLERDFDFEKEALERLQSAGLTILADAVHMRASSAFRHDLVIAPKLEQIEGGRWVDEDRWITFLHTVLPGLRAEGWDIDFNDTFPLSITSAPDAWWASLDESSDIDWFSFSVGITVDGERINLLHRIQELFAELPGNCTSEEAFEILRKRLEGETFYNRLSGGRVVPVPGDRLLPVLRGMLEVFGARREEGEGFSFHLAQATAVSDFQQYSESIGLELENADKFLELHDGVSALGNLEPATPPASFKGELRPYQAIGLAWLQQLRSVGFGGVLADDMGLGKTVQTLAHLTTAKAYMQLDGPVLLVCPTSLIPNWKHETAKFAPGLKVLILHGPERKKRFKQIAEHDLVITTYPLLARDQATFVAQKFDTVILDEAQAIKNPKATVTQVAHQLNTDHRIALTGTPLENNLSELWSIFRFLIPGLLSDSATFRRRFRTPIEKHADKERLRLLVRRIQAFLLRRTKDEVAKDLPPKSEIMEYVALEGPQRDLYETIRMSMHERVREAIAERGLAQSRITILDSLMKLRQVCCDPRLVKMEAAQDVKEGAKLNRLMEMLPSMIAEGRRILLFSQFTSMLDLIREELAERGIEYVLLTGQTKDRETPVLRFQNKEVPLFLISLKAGGVGLNLTAADTVIHYDPWWNPAVENQATDRAHRIGQENPVFVYKLIVKDAVEEAIQELKARKQELADSLFDDDHDDDFGSGLLEDDLSNLFGDSEAPSA